MPPEAVASLEDLSIDLVAKANALAGQINPEVRRGIGDLVCSMNCYYSNLIEGHDTHPRDIDRAMRADYSTEPRKRNLQLEARAHIEVQAMIDSGADSSAEPASAAYAVWLHREFCRRLPDDLLWLEAPGDTIRIKVIPGEYRTGDVQVGLHVPPSAEAVPRFLDRFDEAYNPRHHSKLRQIIAVSAAHHRLLWIHPFYDGNGRVARLLAHSMLARRGVGSSLWSVARGLARNVSQYKTLLQNADEPRRGDLDGRGNLSTSAFVDFCTFFLKICIDQVDYMGSILEPSELLRRMEHYVEDEARADRMPKRAFPILREALLVGEVDRGRAPAITGYQERMARNVVADLLKKGLLISDGPRAPLRLGFPIDVIERWFPRLYPT